MYPTNRKPLIKKLGDKIGYFGDHSSLNGVGYVFSMSHIPLFKRLFWFSVLTVCCYGSTSVLRAALGLYVEDAVNYSVETDYLEWETPFPAVTLCEYAETDRMKNYVSVNKVPASLTNFLKDVTFWNAKYCKSCVTCKINQTCVNSFTELVNDIRWKCTQMLTDCWWDDKPFPCCDRFQPINTEYGLCFVFNSRLTGNGSLINVNRRVGLPSLVFSAVQAVTIRVHSSNDIVSVALENTLPRCFNLPLINDFEVSLKAEQTINDVSVQSIAPGSRDCLFSYERPAFAQHWPFTSYSYSVCVLYSRAKAQVDVCNCTHHFMPIIGDFPPCDVKGLACLHKNKDLLAVDGGECPMECEDIVYAVIQVSCFRHSGKLPVQLVQRGTRGLVRLGQLPSLRVRRHAIRDMLGLVVDVGGVVGVFFGASLLSVIEIIYLLCIRREC